MTYSHDKNLLNKKTYKVRPNVIHSQNYRNSQNGFIEVIVVIIIALVLLNVLGIDIKEVLAKPWVREFGTYIVSLMKIVWQDILEIIAFIKDLAA